MLSFIEYSRRSRKICRSSGVGFSTNSALGCGAVEGRGWEMDAISVLPEPAVFLETDPASLAVVPLADDGEAAPT